MDAAMRSPEQTKRYVEGRRIQTVFNLWDTDGDGKVTHYKIDRALCRRAHGLAPCCFLDCAGFGFLTSWSCTGSCHVLAAANIWNCAPAAVRHVALSRCICAISRHMHALLLVTCLTIVAEYTARATLLIKIGTWHGKGRKLSCVSQEQLCIHALTHTAFPVHAGC